METAQNHIARRLHIIARMFFLTLSVVLVGYIVFNNLLPFGATVIYVMGKDKDISALEPKDRVEETKWNGENATVQKSDLIYFTTSVPFKFDTATVRMVFQNPDTTQTISAGYQNHANWHYNTKLFDAPFINGLSWKKIGENPTLYQRENKFNTLNDFLINPPKDSIIGTYNYDSEIGNTENTKLQGYKSADYQTVINTPLRGRHVFYAYVDKEPFIMTISKQDLNWYAGPDVATITVYKGNVIVYSAQIDDDGITNGSRKVLPAQEITIKNPGPGLPESGVYKIVIDANEDTVITRIQTNLHKIVVAGSVFLAGNKDIYPGIVSSTSATTLFTNALSLSATTLHKAGVQDIKVGDQTLSLSAANSEKTVVPKDTITKIVVPKQDVDLKGFQGYFAFSQDNFFLPTEYHIVPIVDPQDIGLTDYLLTNYTVVKKVGAWEIQEQTFNIKDMYLQNGKLSWVIETPKLKENSRNIFIQNISVTYKKKAWL